MCGQPWASQVSRGSWVLVEVPPQGDLGGGEARVVGESVGGALLPLARIGGARCDLVVGRDGQVAREKLRLGVGPVETRRAGAVDGQLHADPVEGRGQAQLRGIHVGGGAGLQAPSVRGAVTGAVGFELKQLLLPLAFLQLHNADLQNHTHTHTPGGAVTLENGLIRLPESYISPSPGDMANSFGISLGGVTGNTRRERRSRRDGHKPLRRPNAYLQLQTVSLFLRDLPAKRLLLLQQALQTQRAPIEL